MELRHLKCFQKVAELQHISRAAEELHIAQPALSRMIHGMEEELGVPIFDRNGKSIELNKNGQIVYKYTGEIFDSLLKMRTEIACQKDISGSVVRIAFNSASILIPILTSAFLKYQPDVQVQFSTRYRVAEPNTVFRIDSFSQSMDSPSFMPLLREKFLLAFPAHHRFNAMEEIRPEDLKGETFLFSKECHSIYDTTQALCNRNGFTPTAVMECVSSETVLSFLDSGLGIALIPHITWNLCHHPNIQTREVPGGPFYRVLYLQSMFPVDNFPAALEFREFCANFFDEVQDIAKKHDTTKESIIALLTKKFPYT